MEEKNLVVYNSRNKIGQYKKAFESPKAMFESAVSYFEQLHNNPLYVIEQAKKVGKETIIPFKGADGKEDYKVIPPELMIEIPKKRAATWQGLALFWGVNSQYFFNFRQELRDGRAKDPEGHWDNVMGMIADMIFSYNYEAAAAEQINPGLTKAYLGISDKIEQKTEITEKKEIFKIGDIEIEL